MLSDQIATGADQSEFEGCSQRKAADYTTNDCARSDSCRDAAKIRVALCNCAHPTCNTTDNRAYYDSRNAELPAGIDERRWPVAHITVG
jgi:hypothetical protein